MQSRFWISTYTDFDKASIEKKKLQEKNPDKVYQIRKGRDYRGIIFRLVERLNRNEAEVIKERRNPTGYTIRRSKKQRREREISSIL